MAVGWLYTKISTCDADRMMAAQDGSLRATSILRLA
jgi:hypothetical protein